MCCFLGGGFGRRDEWSSDGMEWNGMGERISSVLDFFVDFFFLKHGYCRAWSVCFGLL